MSGASADETRIGEEDWRYLAQLTVALQNLGLPGRRVGDLVAEVAAHLEDTEGDPVLELGPAGGLAVELSARSRTVPAWLRWLVATHAILLPVFAGGLVLALAVEAALSGSDVSLSWSPVILGGGVSLIAILLLRSSIVRLDGNSWRGLRLANLAMCLLFTVTAMVVLGSDPLPGVANVSWPVALVLGAAPLILATIAYNVAGMAVRFPDHAQHLRPLTRGPSAGAPPSVPV